MSDMRDLLDLLTEEEIEINDSFDIEIGEDLLIETGVVDILEDGYLLEGDEITLQLLSEHNVELVEVDDKVIPFPGPKVRQGQIPLKGLTTKGEPATVTPFPGKNPLDFYKTFVGMVNPNIIKTEDDFLTQAYNFLEGQPNIKNLPKEKIYDVALNMLEIHKQHTAKDKFYEGKSLIAKGIFEGIRRSWPMQMGSSSDASSAGSKVLGEEGIEESGLQAYLGKKKYGPEGMKALQKAGRDGASKEKMAKLRAKYDKLDEVEVNEEEMDEAKYQGREVPLGKPMAGDVKKSKVYVKKPNGKVVKVNFGDKKMRIKKSNPKRRKSFRARHNCKNPGPRWKARYWSCRAW